jgi:hypothetical protein
MQHGRVGPSSGTMMRAPADRSPRWRPLLIALSVLFLAVLAAQFLRSRELSYREVIVVAFGALGVVALQMGRWGVKVGFLAWVCTLGLGYRTVALTPNLPLHPAEVILWGLLMSLGLLYAVQRGRTEFWLPVWLWLSIPFWVWAWWIGLEADQPWDKMLAELRAFVLLIPLFVVAANVLVRREDWRSSLIVFYATGAWIGGLGILEYLFPGARQLFPGFMTHMKAIAGQEGFQRAAFSFYGSPIATFVCVLAVPVATAAWHWWPARGPRLLTLVAAALQVGGIYIGGYRSIWFLLALQFLLFILVRQGPVWGTLCLVPCLAGYRLLPAVALERAQSLLFALEGNPSDTSATKRWGRASEAWDAALQQPLGHGWAASGWVHSDFIQVAANLGVLAGLLFAGAYLITLLRLGHRFRAERRVGGDGDLGLVLLLSFIAAGGILAMEGVQVLPQLVLPVWFVWVMVEVWLRRASFSSARKGE